MTNGTDEFTPGAPDNQGPNETLEAEVLTATIAAFQRLTAAGRERVLRTLQAFFGGSRSPVSAPHFTASDPSVAMPNRSSGAAFSQDRTIGPKDFMLDKRPKTDVEKIACLAYYLTHYRETPEFKTFDLSKLNTEAAQIKLSNAALASDNAVRAGLLVLGSRGTKRISAVGELYVQALPDRDAAKAAIAHARPRRRGRKRQVKTNSEGTVDSD